MADCNRFDYWIRNWEYDPELVSLGRHEIGWATLSPDGFTSRYEKQLKNLLTTAPLRSLPYATLIVEREILRCSDDRKRFIVDDELPASCSVVAAARLTRIRTLLGIVTGELLASLHDQDNAAFLKDASSPTPRMFAIGRNASEDRIRGQLALIERELNERTTSGLSPESIVAMLGNAIEALAKMAWPTAFLSKRNDFGSVLDEKAHSANDLERRLPRAAQTLYRQYRVPAEHEQKKFCCSFEEARFFVNGIRTLRDLAHRIVSEVR